MEELVEKTRELMNKGLSTEEIADRLNVQNDTATWLKMRAQSKKMPRVAPEPKDFYADWNNIGSSFVRVDFAGLMLSDLVFEAIDKGIMEQPEVVCGVDVDGAPLALVVARELGLPLALIRHQHTTVEEGCTETVTVESSYTDIKGKKILLVDDVITSGARIKIISNYAKETQSQITGAVVLIDKRGLDKIAGVPVKCLVRIVPIEK
jgi:orotate phosphoribosyltransferase